MADSKQVVCAGFTESAAAERRVFIAAHTIVIGRPLYFAAVVTIFLLLLSSFFLAYSQRSEIGYLPYFHI